MDKEEDFIKRSVHLDVTDSLGDKRGICYYLEGGVEK